MNAGNPPHSRFDRDTDVVPAGVGRFEARIDRGWRIAMGPNGGYLAAILLKAMTHALGQPERTARSLQLHFAARPEEGPATVSAVVERSGRSASTLTARLLQGDRLCALATAAFSSARRGSEFCELEMPPVAPPEACAPEPRPDLASSSAPGRPCLLHARALRMPPRTRPRGLSSG